MSEIKVNKISQRSGTAITLGNSGTDFQLPSGADIVAQSGSVITIAAGATITNNGTATGFGATGAVNWDTTPKTTTVTAVSGIGYFVDTTSGAITVNLPAGVAGSIVAISDYANTAATNNITITPNGTNKINGQNQNATISTNGVAVTLIYIDSTRGWKDVNDATLNVTGINPFVLATGGTITTCGDYKIHSFTGPGTFTVTCAGTPLGSTTVDYLVIAGGAGGYTTYFAGGGGAGGYRESKSPTAPWTASPLASSTSLPVSATAYPITVGAGGAANSRPNAGSNSVFSTITSAGGGGGGGDNNPEGGFAGGSGGGGGGCSSPNGAGAGNTPPVSPPQGNSGGPGDNAPQRSGGGGGGAAATGQPGQGNTGGAGGNGTPSSISGSATTRGGGGGGAAEFGGTGGAGGSGGGGTGGCRGTTSGGNGTANTGGGAGAGANEGSFGGTGGSGIVVIRYKFQ